MLGERQASTEHFFDMGELVLGELLEPVRLRVFKTWGSAIAYAIQIGYTEKNGKEPLNKKDAAEQLNTEKRNKAWKTKLVSKTKQRPSISHNFAVSNKQTRKFDY